MTDYKNPTCRGSYALGSACGKCERCADERAKMEASGGLPEKKPKHIDIRPGGLIGIKGETADRLIKEYLDAFNRAREADANSQACVAYAVGHVATLTVQLLIEDGTLEVPNA